MKRFKAGIIVSVMEAKNNSKEGVSVEALTGEIYFKYLKRYALQLSFGDKMFADDIVQHVLIQASEKPPSTGIFRWLRVTAYNYYSMTMRSEEALVRREANSQVCMALNLDTTGAPVPPEESGFPRGEDTSFVELDDRLADELYAPGAKVSPDKAALFAYVYLFDATYQEAAEQFRLPVGTIMSRLHHIRKQLASCPGVAELAREYGIATDNKRTRGNRCVWGRKIDVSTVQ